jgi:hypothetical protein
MDQMEEDRDDLVAAMAELSVADLAALRVHASPVLARALSRLVEGNGETDPLWVGFQDVASTL